MLRATNTAERPLRLFFSAGLWLRSSLNFSFTDTFQIFAYLINRKAERRLADHSSAQIRKIKANIYSLLGLTYQTHGKEE